MLEGLKLRKYITSQGGDCFNTLIVSSKDIKAGAYPVMGPSCLRKIHCYYF